MAKLPNCGNDAVSRSPATGGRRSPAELATAGTARARLPQEGLAASLELAQQIARPFRARDADREAVREWLSRGASCARRPAMPTRFALSPAPNAKTPIDLAGADEVLQAGAQLVRAVACR